MDIVQYLVDFDYDKRLRAPFVAKSLQDVMARDPMALITLTQAVEIVREGEGHPLYKVGLKTIEAIVEGLQGAQSALIEMLISDGMEVMVNHEGEMVMDLGDQEVVF
jgi:hypothetical protein